ncbi:DMT family transporter [Raoultibacter massiliensis]|uniref:DMT family transporter n=1 Tax=Raoultibacter massiliensis TaxID=1852371 RepID=A0ABV1JDC1_9ACTN
MGSGSSDTTKRKRARAVACVVVSSVLFGAVPIVIKEVYATGMDAFGIVLIRMALAAIIMLGVCLASRERVALSGKQLLFCIVSSVLYAASTLLSCMAIRDMSSGLSNVLFHLFPLAVLLMTRFAFGHKVGPVKWISAFVMLAGMLLIFATESGWQFTVGSVVRVGISALCYAAYTLFLGGEALRGVSSRVLTVYACAVSAGACVVALPFVPQAVSTITPEGVALVAVLASICTALPLVLYAYAAKSISSASVSLFANLEPGVTVVAESVLSQHVPSASGLLGCALIIGSGIFVGGEATSSEDEAHDVSKSLNSASEGRAERKADRS